MMKKAIKRKKTRKKRKKKRVMKQNLMILPKRFCRIEPHKKDRVQVQQNRNHNTETNYVRIRMNQIPFENGRGPTSPEADW